MQTQSHGMTHPGLKRLTNEDHYKINEKLRLYIVCDGVGGHDSGHIASEVAVRTIEDFVTSKKQILEIYNAKPSSEGRKKISNLLEQAVQMANTKIYELTENDTLNKKMCTTAVALLATTDYAFIAHVGDTRAYLIRGNKAHQLTEDHNVAMQMKKQGVLNHPNGNALTRAVGIQNYVQVDLFEMELVNGDQFILCTDGLTDNVPSQEFLKYLDPAHLSETPKKLIDLSNARGGHDNSTAIVLKVETQEMGTQALDALKKTQLFGKVPLFRFLAYPEIIKILNLVTIESYPTDTVLFEEGTPGNKMFIIISGRVEVIKSGQTISKRTKGETIGEMALFDNTKRSASIKTKEPATFLVLSRENLFPLLKLESEIAVKILWALTSELTQRLRATSEELTEMKMDIPFLNVELEK